MVCCVLQVERRRSSSSSGASSSSFGLSQESSSSSLVHGDLSGFLSGGSSLFAAAGVGANSSSDTCAVSASIEV
jgi:hypothetical protein